jgi:hypothetical protein
MEGMCGWLDSGASFIFTSGDSNGSILRSGDALVGICMPSALIVGPDSGVVGDCCGVDKATDCAWDFSEVGVAIVRF